MGMCALYEGCALRALVGSILVGSWLNTGPTSTGQSLMAAIRGSRIGLVVPSIGDAIISLCCMAD
jgi:hypothetical protein